MYVSYQDPRLTELSDWLCQDLSLSVQSIRPASSDASFRRYFRIVHAGGCQVAMDAPPEKENVQAFLSVAELFDSIGLRIPKIYQQNRQQGFLLLEDFGSVSLLDHLSVDNVDSFYRKAMHSLLTLQAGGDTETAHLPTYDAPLLQRELAIFHEWFLGKLLMVSMPEQLRTQLAQLLIASALEQPYVLVHRDFHSRNLMVLGDNTLGVIDFQDAVIGPISYDLVSLLRDCYIAWPKQRVEAWAYQYHESLVAAGLLDGDFAQFQRWFDWMGMQRHLKAIGIFARLHLRDNKSGYLADIPRTLNYVVDVCDRYPQLTEMRDFLLHQVIPYSPASA